MSDFKTGLDVETYKKVLAKKNATLFFPSSDSLLMKKKGAKYLAYLEKNNAIKVTMADAEAFDFNLNHFDLNPAQTCFYVFDSFIQYNKHANFGNVQNFFGFDVDCPPDIKYLLLVLAKFSPNNPIFNYLQPADRSELTVAQLETAVEMLESGKALARNDSLFPKEMLARLRQATNSYVFVKFTTANFNEKHDQLVELARHNPLINRIINDMNARGRIT